ncbi:ATP-binding protein [Actinomadura sediminis]|uniref:ATP-binding protein n=1 Tax=Actinomadura sediminis TaxID=1038904 RepID=A0ABW3EVW6_9ACTN
MLASKAAPGLARTLTKARLYKWNCSRISDDALVVASELVTNAVAATPTGGEIRFQISLDSGGVLLAVWDDAPGKPQTRQVVEPTPETLDLAEERWDDNGGWGLPIVAALAAECGYCPDSVRGKWAWARLKGSVQLTV